MDALHSNYCFVWAPTAKNIGDWIVYLKRQNYRRVFLAASDGGPLPIRAYAKDELQTITAKLHDAGIHVGWESYSHLITQEAAKKFSTNNLSEGLFYNHVCPRPGTRAWYWSIIEAAKIYDAYKFDSVYFDALDSIPGDAATKKEWGLDFIDTFKKVLGRDIPFGTSLPDLEIVAQCTWVQPWDWPSQNPELKKFEDWVNVHADWLLHYAGNAIKDMGWLTPQNTSEEVLCLANKANEIGAIWGVTGIVL